MMAAKMLTKVEMEGLNLLPFGKKHPVRIIIETMKAGEAVRISLDDFRWKRKNPNYFCRQVEKKSRKRFRVYKEAARTGWVVKRVV